MPRSTLRPAAALICGWKSGFARRRPSSPRWLH
jgi:hypothetical protein